ncbi:MAG: hypothetical protein B7Z77_01005 [Acidocella sp. 20-58-15]|nr:MAG: hypothetical protein B7Z77_01005 [Acidocella sp. 20-58-15]
MRSAILGVVTWLCMATAVAAQTLTFPALTGRVVDEAGLLDQTDRAAITQSLADLEAQTKDQMVVVTLKSLDGTSIEDYGYQLGRYWQIGQKGEDNGVLLIVVPTEKAVRIEVGYGLEGTLTDATSQIIIQNAILPQFKAGDFPDGIKDGVAEIIKVLNPAVVGSPPPASAPTTADTTPQTEIPVWAVILILLGGVGLMFLCTTTREGRLCRGIMQVIFLMLLAGGRGGSSRGNSSWSGGGGSFGGGGSSGSW